MRPDLRNFDVGEEELKYIISCPSTRAVQPYWITNKSEERVAARNMYRLVVRV